MTIPMYRRLGLGLQRVLKMMPSEPPFTHVCQIGDPILRCESGEVPRNDLCAPHLNYIISCMKKVMDDYKILGLSACQIGIPLRIIAVQLPKSMEKGFGKEALAAMGFEETPLTVVINPKMTVISYDKVLRPEQCASIKGFSAVVPRYAAVNVKGYGEDGKKVSLEGSGLLGRVLQHEMDHINGKLYVDCMDSKTFQNDGWQDINKSNGAVSIHYLAEKGK